MEKAFKRLVEVSLLIAVGGITAVVGALPLMGGLFVLHGYFDAVPPLSYVEAAWVLWAWRTIWVFALRNHNRPGPFDEDDDA